MTLPDGSRAAEIVRIPFHGSEIHTVLVENEPHVVLRPTLDAVGVDYSTQLQKLRTRSWAKESIGQCITIGGDGKPRSMATIGLDGWAMLLANIDENRVRDNVKPILIEFQHKSAKALRDFWTKGGAVNPAATDQQLAHLEDEIAERRAAAAKRDLSVIDAMGSNVGPNFKEKLVLHTWATYKGEKPEIAPEDRLLMVQPYLVEKRVSKADIASIGSVFGKRVKAAYVAEYGREPEEVLALLNGRERPMKGYYERDRFLFDAVFAQHYAHLAGPEQLELGAA